MPAKRGSTPQGPGEGQFLQSGRSASSSRYTDAAGPPNGFARKLAGLFGTCRRCGCLGPEFLRQGVPGTAGERRPVAKVAPTRSCRSPTRGDGQPGRYVELDDTGERGRPSRRGPPPGRRTGEGDAGSLASSKVGPLVAEGTVEVLRSVHDGHAAPVVLPELLPRVLPARNFLGNPLCTAMGGVCCRLTAGRQPSRKYPASRVPPGPAAETLVTRKRISGPPGQFLRNPVR